ncbi:unnamed protein product [Effrenium voratum]|nr:unnamed protein product [Effrenium voratum]
MNRIPGLKLKPTRVGARSASGPRTMYRGAGTMNAESFKGAGRGSYRRNFDRTAATGRGAGGYRREYQQHAHNSSTNDVEQNQEIEVQKDSVWSSTLISSGPGCKWADQDAGDEIWAGPPAADTALGDLEHRIESMSQDFTSNLRKLGEKGNEKFDIIFSILTELQSRQAQLEETVRVLQSQVNAGYGAGNNSPTSMEGNINVSNSPANGAQGNGSPGTNSNMAMNNFMVLCQPNGMMQQMPQMMYAIPNMMTPMNFVASGSENLSSPSGTSGFVSNGQEGLREP